MHFFSTRWNISHNFQCIMYVHCAISLDFASKYRTYSTSFRSYESSIRIWYDVYYSQQISARMCYFEKVIKLKPQKHIRCFIYFNDNLHELANERTFRENSSISKIKDDKMCEILQASALSISTYIICTVQFIWIPSWSKLLLAFIVRRC